MMVNVTSAQTLIDGLLADIGLKGQIFQSSADDCYILRFDDLVIERSALMNNPDILDHVFEGLVKKVLKSPAFLRKLNEIEKIKAENAEAIKAYEGEIQNLLKYKNYVDIAKELK